MSSMKKSLWNGLVLALHVLPAKALQQVTAICMDSLGRGSSRDALTRLFEVSDRLDYFLNRAALDYGLGTHPKHRLMSYHQFFVDHIHPGEKVLDVGCGYGAVSESMARAGAEVTGIDLDAGLIEQARRRVSSLPLLFIVGDITHDLPVEHYDIIVLSNVLEHLANRVNLLKTLNIRYHPRAMLIRVPMMSRHWTVPLRRELGLFHYSDPTHIVEYTEQSFREEMSAAGLDVLELKVCWGEIWAHVGSGDMEYKG